MLFIVDFFCRNHLNADAANNLTAAAVAAEAVDARLLNNLANPRTRKSSPEEAYTACRHGTRWLALTK